MGIKKSKLTDLSSYSAYQGGSWSARRKSHALDMSDSHLWKKAGYDSEYSTLTEVALYHVPRKIPQIRSPEAVQHLKKVSWAELQTELQSLKKSFTKEKVKVHLLDTEHFADRPPNLMFLRDHFFSTPWGVVLGRLGSNVRAGEEKWTQNLLAGQGIPILTLVLGKGTFEAADALWLNPKKVIIGIGNRTNAEGFRQVAACLKNYGVRCVAVKLTKKTQHLLGLLQFVNGSTALLRTEIAPPVLATLLKKNKVKIIAVPEIDEVTQLQAMNIVVLSPNKIIMPADCPVIKNIYLKNNLKIAAEVKIKQLINAAGGIACATGILSRKSR
ncbi:MAG: dimethylarginine dimethylaminohydrolase family protein [Pseudobdellovibrio sp.]